MSVESIIHYIKNEYYINNNEISKYNYFKGDINEYNENLLNIFLSYYSFPNLKKSKNTFF